MSKKFSLSFTRETSLTPAQIWQGWTDAETIKKWFTPAPWKTVDARIDLRVGGEFFTHMKGPNAGEEFQGTGCVLEILPQKRFTWTSALRGDYQPNVLTEGAFFFTGIIEIEPNGDGAIYKCTALHADEAGMKTHEQMGFEPGWNAAFDQLEAYFNG